MSQSPDDQPNHEPNRDFRLVPVQNSSENQLTSSISQTPNLPVQDSRQPQTLQDLLTLSTRLQSSSNENPTEHLTSERAQFLRNALNSMTTNLVPEMKEKLDVLKETQTKPESVVDANLSTYEETLEQLVEYLYEIDLAQIFYQINGLEIIAPLLKSKHASLRCSAASIILECCKNNPFCQELSVSEKIFGPLMEMATSDPNKDAMFKAIAAVSAIIGSNPAGIRQFNKYDGIKMVEKALNSGSEKIVNKTIFLVINLCDTDGEVKKVLTESGIVVTLITLLHLSDYIVKEYTLRALLSITKDNVIAQQVCQQHDLQTYLRSLCKTSTDSEYQDLVQCATDLLKIIS